MLWRSVKPSENNSGPNELIEMSLPNCLISTPYKYVTNDSLFLSIPSKHEFAIS